MGSVENIKAFVKDVAKGISSKINNTIDTKELALSNRIDENDVLKAWKDGRATTNSSGYDLAVNNGSIELGTELKTYETCRDYRYAPIDKEIDVVNCLISFTLFRNFIVDLPDSTYVIGVLTIDSKDIEVKVKKENSVYSYMLYDGNTTTEFNKNSNINPIGNSVKFTLYSSSKYSANMAVRITYKTARTLKNLVNILENEDSLYEQLVYRNDYKGSENDLVDRVNQLLSVEEGTWEPKLSIYYLIYKDTYTYVGTGTVELKLLSGYDNNKATYKVVGDYVHVYCACRFEIPSITLEDGKYTKITSVSLKGLPFSVKISKFTSIEISNGSSTNTDASGSLGATEIDIARRENKVPIPSKVEDINYNIYICAGTSYLYR